MQTLDGTISIGLDPDLEVPAASTIKLPLMIATFQAIQGGHLSAGQRHTVRAADIVGGAGILQGQVGRSLTTTELLETTLMYSDNTGANMLVNAGDGMDAVNETMAEFDYRHTRMRRLLMDVAAQNAGRENTTSAADLTNMLLQIRHGSLVSSEASAEMLRILRARGRVTDPSLDFMGRHLTPRPSIEHVNGTLTSVRNDAGIVEQDDMPFSVVILLHDQANESAAEEAIARSTTAIASVLKSGQ